MTAQYYDFNVEQGIDWDVTLELKNPDNSIKDLTGYTAKMGIKANSVASNIIASIEDGDGITITGNQGKIRLTLSNTITQTFTFETAIYDLILTDPANKKIKLLKGKIINDKIITV